MMKISWGSPWGPAASDSRSMSEHFTHTAKPSCSPKQDGFVYATMGEGLSHSSCLNHVMGEDYSTRPNHAWGCEAIEQ